MKSNQNDCYFSVMSCIILIAVVCFLLFRDGNESTSVTKMKESFDINDSAEGQTVKTHISKDANYVIPSSWWNTKQEEMPPLFESTRQRCTDGCIIRVKGKGIYIDNECSKMCNDGNDGQYQQNLWASIMSEAQMYDH